MRKESLREIFSLYLFHHHQPTTPQFSFFHTYTQQANINDVVCLNDATLKRAKIIKSREFFPLSLRVSKKWKLIVDKVYRDK